MHKYVAAYINFFDNELVLEQVEADSNLEALKKHSKIGTSDGWPAGETYEDALQSLFDGDCAGAVIRVDSKPACGCGAPGAVNALGGGSWCEECAEAIESGGAS